MIMHHYLLLLCHLDKHKVLAEAFHCQRMRVSA